MAIDPSEFNITAVICIADKKYRLSTHLVDEEYPVLFTMSSALELSQYTVTGPGFSRPSATVSLRSQIASLTAAVNAQNSAIVEEEATKDCFFDAQLIGAPAKVVTKDSVDLP